MGQIVKIEIETLLHRLVEMSYEAHIGRRDTDRAVAADALRAPMPAWQRDGQQAAMVEARRRMLRTGQWSDTQFMGRRWPIGCVALEITQRCNLDCTACYLSETSEAVKDLPIQEVLRRIDRIFEHYGPYTDVQVTGGDPTLRKREELIEIVRRIRQRGMRPTLMTNGIRATRDLLRKLAEAGLVDVTFHVDLTQQRRGFASEVALNAIRQEYIERARGLGLAVMFNTTVFAGNIAEIPAVVAFFIANSDIVRLASFQITADTGRTVPGLHDGRLNIASIKSQIELGASTTLSFDTMHIGHSQCNRYAMAAVVNGTAYDVLDDPELVRCVLERTAHLQFDRQSRLKAVAALARGLVGSPSLAMRASIWLARKVWLARRELVRARGRVNKLSFFIHNFMGACSLEQARIDACVFAAATQAGPISMCLHNAMRDAFILDPIPMEGDRFWNPLFGTVTTRPEPGRPGRVPDSKPRRRPKREKEG